MRVRLPLWIELHNCLLLDGSPQMPTRHPRHVDRHGVNRLSLAPSSGWDTIPCMGDVPKSRWEKYQSGLTVFFSIVSPPFGLLDASAGYCGRRIGAGVL